MHPARFLPNYRNGKSGVETQLAAGADGSPAAKALALLVESFTDEPAGLVTQDPSAFRWQLLGERLQFTDPDFATGRSKWALSLAAKKAPCARRLQRGPGMGIAGHRRHAGYIAEAIELEVKKNGEPVMLWVSAAVDAGPIINLGGAEQQAQGPNTDPPAAA